MLFNKLQFRTVGIGQSRWMTGTLPEPVAGKL